MWHRISTVTLVSLALLVLPGQAQADGTITWDTAGDSNLPCSYGAHWIILGPSEILNATLTVGSDSFTMTSDGYNWVGDSGPVPLAPTAYATFTGDANDTNHLQLTGCIVAPTGGGGGGGGGGGDDPAPTPSPGPTQTEPQSSHDITVICKNWTWAKAKHLRLIQFSRNGESVYRCVKP